MILPKAGQRWIHYKGSAMVVVDLGFEETTGNVVVIYKTFDGLTKTRPLNEWLGVVWSGSKIRKRYTYEKRD